LLAKLDVAGVAGANVIARSTQRAKNVSYWSKTFLPFRRVKGIHRSESHVIGLRPALRDGIIGYAGGAGVLL
jgi:hypothetical protein